MKRIIILTFVISSILSACCKTKYYIIPEKDRFKIHLFDTMIFKSNLQNTDTLYISGINSRISPLIIFRYSAT